ncbi:MAG: hypothetical protein KGL39_24135 [Patescibacteria group bacterium]|nr:hypothetical protein [Patescibacteria group bacterium]
MSGTSSIFPIVNFPAVGPVGGYYQFGPGGGIQQVLADQSGWVGGPWIISLLAELRIQTQLLYAIYGNENTSLSQMRTDAVNDMGTLYATGLSAPVQSS